jgi:hypothetical protein
MIGIKVCRQNSFPGQCSDEDPFLNWGDDISDVLLVNEEVALERGRVEIDSVYTNRINASVSVASRDYIAPGSFVGVNDEGEIKSGLLKAINISVVRSANTFQTATNMTIERNL